MPLFDFSITTDRLHICALQRSHLADLMEINGDGEVTKYLPYNAWVTREDAEAWYARMYALSNSGSGRQFVLRLRDSGSVIGTVLLFKYDELSQRIEIGYVLGRAYWRQGFMREALTSMLAQCFDAGGLRRIEAEVNPLNEPSNRLLLDLNFTIEGRARKRWVAKGFSYDTNLYGLLADEWK